MADTKTPARSRAASAAAEGTVGKQAVSIEDTVDADEEALLSELRHSRGCPLAHAKYGTEEARIEIVRHNLAPGDIDRVGRAGSTPKDGSTIHGQASVVRCVECGAQFPEG